MGFFKRALIFLAAWLVAFLLLGWHSRWLSYLQRWMAEVYPNPTLFWSLAALVGMLAAVAGFVLVFPVIWSRRNKRLSFNHKVFWPVAIPSLIILGLPILVWNHLLNWLGPIVGNHMWMFVMDAYEFNAFAGGLIGVAFGLALIIKDE